MYVTNPMKYKNDIYAVDHCDDKGRSVWKYYAYTLSQAMGLMYARSDYSFRRIIHRAGRKDTEVASICMGVM